MYMAVIGGWDSIQAFSENREKAKRTALKAKKSRCKDDLDSWTWNNVTEYYGGWVVEIKEGTVLNNNS